MTSSIYLKTQNPLKIDNTLIQEIESIFKKRHLEHLNITDRLGGQILSYVAGTIQYWKNIIPKAIWPEFKETKVIEVYSFYKGYISAGGELPFQSDQKVPEIKYEVKKNIHDEYNVVIPIGFLSEPILSILSKSITAYANNRRIKKIICVYDKAIEDINRIELDPKIETVLVDQPGPAYARNKGITQSLEEGLSDVILADSDLLVYPSDLAQIIQGYEKSREVIACPILLSHGTTRLDHYHDINGTLNGRYLDGTKKQLLFGTTSIMCINESFFERGKLFSTDFKEAAGEDIDFCLNALIDGIKIHPLDHIKIRHWYGYLDNVENNIEVLIRRFGRYGRGEHQLLGKHPYYHKMLSKTVHRPSIDF